MGRSFKKKARKSSSKRAKKTIDEAKARKMAQAVEVISRRKSPDFCRIGEAA